MRIIQSNIQGDHILNQAKEISLFQSNLAAKNILSQGQNMQVKESQIKGSQIHQLQGNLSIEHSQLLGAKIENIAKGKITVKDSSLLGQMIIQDAEENISIKNSNIFGSYVTNVSGGSITVDSSEILFDHSLFFKAIANYLAINSNLSLIQYPYKLFTHNFSAIDSQGNPLIRCGITLREVEILGIVDARGYVDNQFSKLQCSIIDSSNIDLSIFSKLSKPDPKGIFIDAASGTIIGSSLQAKDHHVIIKTSKGIELLPLGIYNAAMFGGGLNDQGIKYAIAKIEAGLIDIDGGNIIKMVGALLRANSGQGIGSLKADYIINPSNVAKIVALHSSFVELKPWVQQREMYDYLINGNVVKSKLEFKELTKIEITKGKVNLYYPYTSKKVILTQVEGNVIIDRDVDVSSSEIMVVNAEHCSILFGMPKVEQKILKMKSFGLPIIKNTHYTHVNVKANDLFLNAGKDVDIHATIESKNLGIKAGGDLKVTADKYNFGQEIKNSVIRSDNVYFIADNIEIKGSLIKVKNNLKIVTHNDVRILPVELINSYYNCKGKTTVREHALKQVVSKINSGLLNIAAGKILEFISTLIDAENIKLKSQRFKK